MTDGTRRRPWWIPPVETQLAIGILVVMLIAIAGIIGTLP